MYKYIYLHKYIHNPLASGVVAGEAGEAGVVGWGGFFFYSFGYLFLQKKAQNQKKDGF